MKIKKTFQGVIPENKILNSESTSQADTYSCDYINEKLKEIYLTEEHVIGKWVNNKPIYRRVINFISQNTVNLGWTYIENIENIENLINIYGFLNNSTPIPRYESSNYYMQFLVEASNKNLCYICNGLANYNTTVILEYTKTTD